MKNIKRKSSVEKNGTKKRKKEKFYAILAKRSAKKMRNIATNPVRWRVSDDA